MEHSAFSDPDVTPFVICPNCARMLAFGTEQCPDCREIIDEDYALLSAGLVTVTTQAASQANFLKTFDPAVVVAVAQAGFAYAMDWYWLYFYSFAVPLMALGGILRWYVRFGRFPITDGWYREAKADMKSSLVLWCVLFGLQLLVAANWSLLRLAAN
jgi:hypothetical protein